MNYYSEKIEFLSIVIPAFNRYHYLEKLIESIHRYADAPFELIVHDDNSGDGAGEKIASTYKGKVSSVILNGGLNVGLSESINRCVSIASSKYILMLNADILLYGPIMRDLLNILKVNFIGVVKPANSIHNMLSYLADVSGSAFALSRGVGSGSCLAFRKDTFFNVGGWSNSTTTSSNADVVFMSKVLRHGYFCADPYFKEQLVRNDSMEKLTNSDSTIASVQCDCSLPRIFGISNAEYVAKSFEWKDMCNERMQKSYRAESGEANVSYWQDYLNSIVKEDQTVDWDVARRHGQIKWREEVEKLRSQRNG